MNRPEQVRFNEKELKGLWPQWTATDAKVGAWMSYLAGFDYSIARRAAQACFAELTVNSHRPLLGRFLAKARAVGRSTPDGGPRPSRDPTTDGFLECVEPPKGKPHMVGVRKAVYVRPLSRQSDPDYVLACADSMRRHFDRLYGGTWLVVRSPPAPARPA